MFFRLICWHRSMISSAAIDIDEKLLFWEIHKWLSSLFLVFKCWRQQKIHKSWCKVKNWILLWMLWRGSNDGWIWALSSKSSKWYLIWHLDPTSAWFNCQNQIWLHYYQDAPKTGSSGLAAAISSRGIARYQQLLKIK